MIKILYFARYKDALNCSEEQLDLTPGISTAANLRDYLCERGAAWQSTVGDSRTLVAINQEISNLDSPINDGDEVAFFPPVTGG